VDLRCPWRSLVRTAFSLLGGGVLYFFCMAAFLWAARLDSPAVETVLWLLAPVVTAVGFAAGVATLERPPGWNKDRIPAHSHLAPGWMCTWGWSSLLVRADAHRLWDVGGGNGERGPQRGAWILCGECWRCCVGWQGRWCGCRRWIPNHGWPWLTSEHRRVMR